PASVREYRCVKRQGAGDDARSPRPMTQTFLVTGAAGFVGRSVAETALGRGHQVIALDRGFDKPVAGARCIEADIRDPEAVVSAAEHADAAIHCAAIVGPKPANADP